MSNFKQMWELTDTVKMHNERMQEMVVALNQIIDHLGKITGFVNGLSDRINDLNDGLMELAREVYKDGEEPS